MPSTTRQFFLPTETRSVGAAVGERLTTQDLQRFQVRDRVQGMVPRTLLRVLMEYLEARGAVISEVFPFDRFPSTIFEADEAGVVHQSLARFPLETYCQLLQCAVEYLQDPLLSLHLGQAIRPSHLGALGYVLLNCENLGGALVRIQRYHRLLNDLNPIEPSVSADSLELRWGMAHGRPGALFDESGVAAFVEFGRQLCRQRLVAKGVDFVNPPPADPQPFVNYFGCPVRWGQPVTRLIVPLAMLEMPLADPDPTLLKLMEAQIEAIMDALPVAGDLVDMTRRIVAHMAREGVPELEQVAAALKLSPRIYYRRLADQDVCFRQLRDETLRSLAETHLRDPRLSIAEVAQLLGYTEPSAFTRAFRRWSGQSPRDWRLQTRYPGEA